MNLIAALFFTAFSVGLFGLALKRKGPALIIFSGVFFFGHALPLLGAAGFDLIDYAQFPHARPDYDAKTFLAVALAYTGIGFAYLSLPTFSGPPKGIPPEGTHRGRPAWHYPRGTRLIRRMNWLLLAAIVGLLAAAPGGIGALLYSNFSRLLASQSDVSSTLLYIVIVLYSVSATIQAVIDARRGRPLSIHMLFACVAFFILGGRLQFFITACTFGLIMYRYGYVTKKMAVTAVALMMFPIIFTIYARATIQGKDWSVIQAASFLLDDMSMLGAYNLSTQFVAENGHRPFLWGTQIMSLVPRALNPDKAEQISIIIRRTFWHDEISAIPPGMIGEFYIIGGLAFCLIGGLLFGAVLRWLDRAFLQTPNRSIISQAMVMVYIPIASFYFVRAGFDSSIFRIAIALAAFGGFSFLLRTGRQRRVSIMRASQSENLLRENRTTQ